MKKRLSFKLKLKDIQKHPEKHRHAFGDLMECCKLNIDSGGFIKEVLDMRLLEAHKKSGINGGERCDVIKGPCSCGAWH
jgi:hypothetical protein